MSKTIEEKAIENGKQEAFNEHCGITKREWFAGLAMQGIIANDGPLPITELSILSYKIADEMLKGGEK